MKEEDINKRLAEIDVPCGICRRFVFHWHRVKKYQKKAILNILKDIDNEKQGGGEK